MGFALNFLSVIVDIWSSFNSFEKVRGHLHRHLHNNQQNFVYRYFCELALGVIAKIEAYVNPSPYDTNAVLNHDVVEEFDVAFGEVQDEPISKPSTIPISNKSRYYDRVEKEMEIYADDDSEGEIEGFEVGEDEFETPQAHSDGDGDGDGLVKKLGAPNQWEDMYSTANAAPVFQ